MKSVDLPSNQIKYAPKRKEVVSLSSHERPKPHPNLEFIPPVPHLLTSNASPSDAERALIQDAIEEVSVRHVLDPDPALQFIRLRGSVLSTFRRFPHEIIGDIFGRTSYTLLRHLRSVNSGDRFLFPFPICGHILGFRRGNCRLANPPSPF